MAVATLALLAGCSRIPLSSLWSLRQFSFEEFEPALLRVAVHLPAALAMPRDALRVEARIQREGEAARIEHFTLQETREQADTRGLPAVDAEGRWVVLALSAEEAERLRALRGAATAAKAQSGRKGSLELRATPQFCRTGAAVPQAARLSGALMWSHDKGYVPLLQDAELDELLKSLPTPVPIGKLPPC